MMIALFAAASTLGAGDAADGAAVRALPAPATCALVAGPLEPQQSPPQTGETPPEEKGDARKKSGTGEQVRKYVDERAPRIADWLFDSPTQSPGYGGEPLRNRGMRSLPPVAAGPRTSNDLTVLDELGFVIAGAEPKIVYIVSTLPARRGAPIDVRPNDVILALNGQEIDTPHAFRSRYGRLRPGHAVELRLRRGELRLTVAFYKPGGDELPGRGSLRGAEPPGLSRHD